jgi:hypothetical protein
MGISNLSVTSEEKQALTAIQQRLIADYGVEELVVFGAGVKSEPTGDKDPDLLALTGKHVSLPEKQAIMNVVSEINQAHGTSIRIMVFDKATWEIWSGQILYQEVARDGVWT